MTEERFPYKYLSGRIFNLYALVYVWSKLPIEQRFSYIYYTGRVFHLCALVYD